MEPLPSLRHSHHYHLLHHSLNRRHSTPCSSFFFLSFPPLPPSSSSPPFRLSPIKASHSNSPKNPSSFHKPQNTLLQTLIPLVSPLLKTTCIAAALFLMRLRLNSPAPAADVPLSTPTPAAESTPDNLTGEENGSVEALRSLMEAKIREGKIDEAVRVIDRLIELAPEESDWLLLKAHLCARRGKHASARDLYEEVLKRDPFRVEALHGLLMATTELKEPTKGLSPRLEEAVRFCESHGRVSEATNLKLLIAQVKILEGKLFSALKVYEEIAEEEPKDFRPYLCQGVVYTMMRENDEAERQFQKFRGLVPEDHPYKEYFEDNATNFLQKMLREGTAVKR